MKYRLMNQNMFYNYQNIFHIDMLFHLNNNHQYIFYIYLQYKFYLSLPQKLRVNSTMIGNISSLPMIISMHSTGFSQLENIE